MNHRPARTDVPSMYAEEDAFEEEFTRSADIRQSRASLSRGSRYYTEGFVQYSQPSLNGTYPPFTSVDLLVLCLLRGRRSVLCCVLFVACDEGGFCFFDVSMTHFMD